MTFSISRTLLIVCFSNILYESIVTDQARHNLSIGKGSGSVSMGIVVLHKVMGMLPILSAEFRWDMGQRYDTHNHRRQILATELSCTSSSGLACQSKCSGDLQFGFAVSNTSIQHSHFYYIFRLSASFFQNPVWMQWRRSKGILGAAPRCL